jgi:OmpA-OmpF porin, OOP family
MTPMTISALVRATLIVLVLPATLLAQEKDAEGSKDHPMVPRLAGGQYFIGDYEEQGFASHTFTVQNEEEKTVEGKFVNIHYWLKEGGKKYGPLEVIRNYRNAFLQKKGEALYEHADTYAGHATFRLPLQGRALWVEVRAENAGEVYRLAIIEEAALVQNVEITSSAMSSALASTGTVTLRGILFETGKADIKPESAPILAEIAKLLEADEALKLEIQGHTDNVGTSAANLALSRQRADAVKTWLVNRHSIDAARLTATGLGDTKPVADNKTEEGRAQNRRVELVKK